MKVKHKKTGKVYRVIESLYIQNRQVYKLLDPDTKRYIFKPKVKMKMVKSNKSRFGE